MEIEDLTRLPSDQTLKDETENPNQFNEFLRRLSVGKVGEHKL